MNYFDYIAMGYTHEGAEQQCLDDIHSAELDELMEELYG